MKLEGLLKQKTPDILKRWRLLITRTYPPETARFLENEKDRFANPVGHFIRHGTSTVLEELVGDMDREAIGTCIDPLLRIRAVQAFGPSQAVDVAFLLKQAVRDTVAGEVRRKGLEGEQLEWETRIDDLARIAFDTYVRCREQMHEIRVREIKNRSAVLLRRMNADIDEPCPGDETQGGEA
jgi:hypothetical protein